jgi:hypothetical protein
VTDPENLVLVYLRRMDAKLDTMREDITDLKRRMTTVEIQIGSLIATEQQHYAQTMLRMDAFDARLERIERQLDLTEDSKC